MKRRSRNEKLPITIKFLGQVGEGSEDVYF